MNAISSSGANKRRSSAPPPPYTDDGFPVTKVYYSFENHQLTAADIATYFNSAGKVVDFEYRHSCSKPIHTSEIVKYHTFGFAQYQQPEHATEVISRSPCNIDGVYIRVKEADSCQQPKVPYAKLRKLAYSTTDDDNTASEDSNGIPVPELNAHCLREIFGHLNVLDLISVAEVCPHFQSIARQQFSSKHKVFYAEQLIKAAKGVKVSIQVWERFLKQFGREIKNITVFRDSIVDTVMDNQALELIVTHCSQTLNVLRVGNFAIEDQFVQKLRPLFARLEKLDLMKCEFTNYFVQMLEDCHRLTNLSFYDEVERERSEYTSLQFHLPQLKKISFYKFGGLSNQQVERFLERNPQLKKVSIFDCDGVDADILPEIVRQVPLVEEITFGAGLFVDPEQFIPNALHLKQLRSLKKLKLDYSGNRTSSIFREMASAKVPLEFLEVINCKANQKLFSSICELKTLNTVSLLEINALKASHLHEVCKNLPGLCYLILDVCPDPFSMADLIQLVRHATKLELLSFWLSFSLQIDIDTFKTLIGIINKRPDSLSLKIFVPNRSTAFNNVPDELITANREKLIIN